ncbi:MAG TPA: SLBB domain-containing protein [Candidatus Eremiobacteraeota bacterium]|nr:MAG: Electron transport complex protein RnfC [bacterium ADurb.Bin363]HPZ09785.1 SLBB domain-containing protein [Candidatus Eremiobacteraeota bacterium]
MKVQLSRGDILKSIINAGVVGGGGAGFPTHIKYKGHAEIIIVNGAECEPLLRVDQQFMSLKTEEIIEGLKMAMSVTGATKGIIALKGKYKDAIKAFETILPREPSISMHIMGNYYPAGDEQTLVYEVTGKVVPEGGIPLAVGVIVSNVVTVYNVFRACNGKPVILRPLTVTGEVEKPLTLNVPVGTLIKDVLAFAGGVKIENPVIIRGGPMMGSITTDMDQPVTKTDSGLIVLPSTHYLVKNRRLDMKRILKHSMMCEQCSYCTMLCPRYMLGHNLQPHMIMRIVGYGLENASLEDLCQAFLCCQCGLCSLFSCPVDLQPREVYGGILKELKEKGISNPHKRKDLVPRPFMKLHRISAYGLVTRLEVSEYDVKAPWNDMEFTPSRVVIPLLQHIGCPSIPVVKTGDTVKRGQLIGVIPEGSNGASIHASISGRVVEVSSSVVIER